MKNIKKFLLTTAMTMALGTSAFAASGFEFLLNLSGGINVTIPTKETEDLQAKGGLGGFAGLDAQIRYMFQVKDGFGISVLGELGYAHDTYAMTFPKDMYEAPSDVKVSLSLDSLQLGLLPKFNIGALAIGIGGGGQTVKVGDAKETVKYAMGDVLGLFSPPVIGYVKATFDYSIFFLDNLAFNIGLYLGGDIAKQDYGMSGKINYSSFDIGVELGLKFGPKA